MVPRIVSEGVVARRLAQRLGLSPRLASLLLRSRGAATALLAFGSASGEEGPLARDEQELVVLRALHNCKAAAAFQRRAEVARRAGVAETVIGRARVGAVAPGLSCRQAALLAAVDELHEQRRLRAGVRSRIAGDLSERELFSVAVLVGFAEAVALCEAALEQPAVLPASATRDEPKPLAA